MLANFPVLRLRLHFTPVRSMRWPAFAGSALRGAWGHALRRQVCVMHREDCAGCPLKAGCDFTRLFEIQAAHGFGSPPQPYVIDAAPIWAGPLPAGQPCHFDFVLIGQAISRLYLVVETWRSALAGGLGRQRVPCRLESVTLPDEADRILFSLAAGWSALPDTTLELPPPHPTGELWLSFHTPLRIKIDNDLLGAREITPRHLLEALIRRVKLLAVFHCGTRLALDEARLGALADAVDGEKTLRWMDQDRYSSRQQTQMKLGGLLGDWRLSGPLTEFVPFLYLGQWLHVGKGATLGLGGYRLLRRQPERAGDARGLAEGAAVRRG